MLRGTPPLVSEGIPVPHRRSAAPLSRWAAVGVAAALSLAVAVAVAVAVVGAGPARAAQLPVGLGSAATFAVVAGTAVTNTGASVLSGDLGADTVTGFPPGTLSGKTHRGDAAAARAQADTATAYDDLAARGPAAPVAAELGGQTLAPGVHSGGALGLTGTLTLDAGGDPAAVFVVRAASTLTTAAGSSVVLAGGASACNVFWQIGSSATLGADSQLAGSLLAKVSVTAGNHVTVAGRLLAQAAVSLDADTVSTPRCATVSLAASTSSVRFGAPVTLTATVAPADATGSVVFADADGTVLGTAPVSSGTAVLTGPLSTFGRHTVTATYSGDTTYAAAVSAPVTVEVAGYVGEVIVREFRLSGPGGANDSYVELYNTGPPAPLAGFSVVSSAGTTTLPADAGILGTSRSYLVAGSAFSLGATVDTTGSLGTTGLKVLAPDTAATRTDAVGPAAGPHRGTPLANFAGTPSVQHAWVRLARQGRPVDTGDSAADFLLVSKRGLVIGGVTSMLGAPHPIGTADPFQHNAMLPSALLDPAAAVTAAPNRSYVAGTLTIRRRITNSSGATVTAASVRVTSLSEAHGAPQPGVTAQPTTHAELRATNPSTATSVVGVTGGGTRTVHNLGVGAPNVAAPGGGLNSTFPVPLPTGGLAAGASVDVAFTFAVDAGGAFWFGYDVDALTGTPTARSAALSVRTATGTPGDVGQS